MKRGLRMLAALALLALLVLVAAQLGALRGRAPADLGVNAGRLKAPSSTPNSVSSQADLHPDHPQRVDAAIDPLPARAGGPQASMQALAAALQATPGVALVEQRPDYLRAEATTRWMKYTDDLEFWFNPARNAIEVRSASRLGRKDFGANRARIEALRTRYAAQP